MSNAGYVRAARLAALSRSDELAAELRGLGAPAGEIAATLRAHHLSALVRSVLGKCAPGDVAPGLVAALDAVRPVPGVTHTELHDGFDRVRRRLESAGIPVLLLKGQALGCRLYTMPAARPQYDVDVLVRADQHAAAGRALSADGFTRAAYDLHSVTFTDGGLKIDLHGCLRKAPAYRIDEGAIWASARPIRLGDLDAMTLSDEHTLLLLVLSAFEDLGQGATKLKQLLDLYLLQRELEPSFDWEAFFDRRRRENLAGVVAGVMAIVVALFEAGAELPRLAASLGLRGEPVHADARALALALTFAPPKSPASLQWFKRLYPGSLMRYLASFWLAGFPVEPALVGLGLLAAAALIAWRPILVFVITTSRGSRQ